MDKCFLTPNLLRTYLSTWLDGPDNLYKYKNTTVTFSDDGDGTYSYTTTAPNTFRLNDESAGRGKYYIDSSVLFVSISKDDVEDNAQTAVVILRVSPTRFILRNMLHNATEPIIHIIDKQELPPAIPINISETSSGLTVTLSWTDNSDNETGFKVMRKDSLMGAYALIETTYADVTTFDDVVSTAGTYWYRIIATNSNGDSIGSKVVKVILNE